MSKAKQMRLIGRPERIPRPTSIGARGQANQVVAMADGRLDALVEPEALSRLDESRDQPGVAVDDVEALPKRREFGARESRGPPGRVALKRGSHFDAALRDARKASGRAFCRLWTDRLPCSVVIWAAFLARRADRHPGRRPHRCRRRGSEMSHWRIRHNADGRESIRPAASTLTGPPQQLDVGRGFGYGLHRHWKCDMVASSENSGAASEIVQR
jgi:hypothetical protein